MTKHVQVYMDFFGYGIDSVMLCEIANCCDQVNDCHHIIPRSHFGKKRKGEQDKIENLIGLCRYHHTAAHDNKIPKHELQRQHESFMRIHGKN